MFKFISLRLYDHPTLGTIQKGMDFVGDLKEQMSDAVPYTTLLIGPNGTGKSLILAAIIEIFEDLKLFLTRQKKSKTLSYSYAIEYRIDENHYKVLNRRGKPVVDQKKSTYQSFLVRDGIEEEIHIDNLELPEKIIAVSFLALDRFRAKKNETDDFYVYLGLRDKSNTARAGAFLNNILPLLFDYIQSAGSIFFMKEILAFLGLNQDYLGLTYTYRYKNSFFTGKLTNRKFSALFNDYSKFSRRKQQPFSVDYYLSHIKGNADLIDKIVKFINLRAQMDSISFGKTSHLEFNLLQQTTVLEEFQLLSHLRKLDLISSASLQFRRGVNLPFDANQSSSGEFHFLTTMIAIQTSIEQNSLILIDEPETSLHPNWQMQYIHSLKNIFKNWHGSHFLIASHSHFFVADLPGESSEIVALKGRTPHVHAEALKFDTFGWSPDEILYKIFEVRTVRNHFFELDLRKLAYLLNSNSEEYQDIRRIIEKLRRFSFSLDDPLISMIAAAERFLEARQ